MKFDTPATTNPIDQLKVVGKSLDRIDGPLKTSGTAPYAYEYHDAAPNAAYGYVLGAAIAKGRIDHIDTAEARTSPGVLEILTFENAGPLKPGTFLKTKTLAGPEVSHYHQAVAMVMAETFEQARAAAELIRIAYSRSPGRFDLAADKDIAPLAPGPVGPSEKRVGDFESAFSAAPVTIDQSYTTPHHSHAMMEPHATIAAWEGDKVTCWTSHQSVAQALRDVSAATGIAQDKIRILTPFVGGGFGGKGFSHCDLILGVLGSRMIGRPVKVTLQRPVMFNNTTNRSATIQRIRLGAQKNGRITAIGHENWCSNVDKGWSESAIYPTRHMYAGANRLTRSNMAVLDLPEASVVRAPLEAPGMMALEIAMDEMAEKLGIDPVEFRILNDTQVDPEDPNRPFSIRQLAECFRVGTDKFGWARRNPRPGAVREGRWLVGLGTAAAIRGANIYPSAARIRLSPAGIVTVEADMTDIGTGSYTILGQTAAEMMGVGLDKVVVRLGDSNFPRTTGSGGQFGASASTAGVYAACMKLREIVSQKLGFNSPDVLFANGQVSLGNRSASLADAASDGELVAEDRMEYGDLTKRFSQQTFGAHFVEAAVDIATGEVRVRRMLMVCAAGRILNPKTARSQIIGGMTMGVGAALMEALVIDKRFGYFVNHDLAGYEVPVHADIPHQDVVFLDETDPMQSPLKAKGVGELGISGAAAAVANAIYNATGVRVRDYPITLDKYLDKLPNLA
jgi:xanthine dehydrogenase YagR molybdenum-binding subunit